MHRIGNTRVVCIRDQSAGKHLARATSSSSKSVQKVVLRTINLKAMLALQPSTRRITSIISTQLDKVPQCYLLFDQGTCLVGERVLLRPVAGVKGFIILPISLI